MAGRAKYWVVASVLAVAVVIVIWVTFLAHPTIGFLGDGEYIVTGRPYTTHKLILTASTLPDDGPLKFQFRGFAPACPTSVGITMPVSDLQENLANGNSYFQLSLYRSNDSMPIYQSSTKVERSAQGFPTRIEKFSRWHLYTLQLSVINGDDRLLDRPVTISLWSGPFCEPLL